jgi:hypothetical protein
MPHIRLIAFAVAGSLISSGFTSAQEIAANGLALTFIEGDGDPWFLLETYDTTHLDKINTDLRPSRTLPKRYEPPLQGAYWAGQFDSPQHVDHETLREKVNHE